MTCDVVVDGSSTPSKNSRSVRSDGGNAARQLKTQCMADQRVIGMGARGSTLRSPRAIHPRSSACVPACHHPTSVGIMAKLCTRSAALWARIRVSCARGRVVESISDANVPSGSSKEKRRIFQKIEQRVAVSGECVDDEIAGGLREVEEGGQLLAQYSFHGGASEEGFDADPQVGETFVQLLLCIGR